jgi:two-component system alkaline phosphatase synthesis response regulator PhoP
MTVSKASNILIVEDDKNLGQTLRDYLSGVGHQVTLASTATEAKKLILSQKPQIILMDIGLPDGDGLTLVSQIRLDTQHRPVVLFLSALNDPDTRLEALELGAHDYITKPFNLKELMLRLNRIIDSNLRMQGRVNDIELGNLIISFRRYEILSKNGEVLNLGQKECALLELLVRKISLVVSREEMIAEIWGENAFPSNRTIDNYIVKLRKMIETNNHPIHIESVRGVGYKLCHTE